MNLFFDWKNMAFVRLFMVTVGIMILAGCAPKEPEQGETGKKTPPPEKRVFQPASNIKIRIPEKDQFFSVVINDAEGVRVRQLLARRNVSEFPSTVEGGKRVITVSWDGKDDFGKPAPAGEYQIKGISGPALDVIYEYSFYNPGTPPWEGYKNSHWGANHGDPVTIAAVPAGADSSIRVFVGNNSSEGTDFLFGIGKNDQKEWGMYRAWGGSQQLVVADGELWSAEEHVLTKYAIDGSNQRPGFQRSAGRVPQLAQASKIHSFAVGPEKFHVMLAPGEKVKTPQILVYDKGTSRTNAVWETDTLYHLQADSTGTLYGIPTNQTAVVTFDAQGVTTPVSLPGVVKPTALAFDSDDNLYVMDKGPDHQIKVFDQQRNLLRTIGRKGGGREGFVYHRDGLNNLLALTIDDRGYVWTTEGSNPHPRRQAVWDQEGKLVRDFVGSTWYAAWGATLHDNTPGVGVVQDAIFSINTNAVQEYAVDRFVWSGKKEGSPFAYENGNPWHGFWRANFFKSAVSGKEHEYIVSVATLYPTIYVKKPDGDYRPVAAMWSKVDPQVTPWSRPSDPDKTTIYVWSDLNGDELVQEDEIVTLQTVTSRGCGGSSVVQPSSHELDFYIADFAIKPTRFTPEGAPIYEKEGIKTLTLKGLDRAQQLIKMDSNNPTRPDGYWRRVGNHIIIGMCDWPQPFEGVEIFADLEGNIKATIPWRGGGVHGAISFSGTPKNEEMLFGTVTSGIAKANDDIGHIFASQGYFGQVTFVTEDGIILGQIFKDVRDNPEGHGEKPVKGKSWMNHSMGQEALNAWFGRQDDGKFRYMFGFTAALVLEVTGLEQYTRFDAGWTKLPTE